MKINTLNRKSSLVDLTILIFLCPSTKVIICIFEVHHNFPLKVILVCQLRYWRLVSKAQLFLSRVDQHSKLSMHQDQQLICSSQRLKHWFTCHRLWSFRESFLYAHSVLEKWVQLHIIFPLANCSIFPFQNWKFL